MFAGSLGGVGDGRGGERMMNFETARVAVREARWGRRKCARGGEETVWEGDGDGDRDRDHLSSR